MPPVPLGADGPAGGQGPQRARLALVAGAERDRHPHVRRAQRRACSAATCLWGCADGAKATRRPHALAGGDRARRRAAHAARACGALIDARRTGSSRARSTSTPTATSTRSARRRHDPRARTASARRGCCCLVRRQPDGLANSSGLVGKRLMMHPFGTVVGVFRRGPPRAGRAPWGQHIHSLEFYETDESRGFVRGAKWGLQPTGGPLVDDAAPTRGATRTRSGARASTSACAGGSATRRCGASSPRTCPRSRNRVVLDPRQHRRLRHPGRRRSTTELSENSRRLVDVPPRRARRSRCCAAGALRRDRRAVHPRRPAGTSSAPAMMGDDPGDARSSTPGAARHDVPNLYIFDGSVWPTSSGMNPTATIAALALRFSRAADRVAPRAEGGGMTALTDARRAAARRDRRRADPRRRRHAVGQRGRRRRRSASTRCWPRGPTSATPLDATLAAVDGLDPARGDRRPAPRTRPAGASLTGGRPGAPTS